MWQFRRTLPAFDRALAYARVWTQHDSGLAAQRNYAVLRFRAAELRRQRGAVGPAIAAAVAALASLEGLPQTLRRELESTASLQNARVIAAQGLIDPKARIPLLREAMRNGHQFGHTQVRNRAISLLLGISGAAGDREGQAALRTRGRLGHFDWEFSPGLRPGRG